MSDTASHDSAVPSIDAQDLAAAIRRGIHNVVSQQELLNKINVFPVADGDTGTNLALTMASAEATLTEGAQNIAEMLAKTADALLDGARGNSGAIMAQFFQGLADGSNDTDCHTVDTLTGAVQVASDYARDAIAEPREGTILTVITVFADALRQATARQFEPLFETALARCNEALARTPDQLPVLKKAGVVDAGAQGFCALIEGIAAYFVDGRTPEHDIFKLSDIDTPHEVAGADSDLDYRFCTECMISGTDIDRRRLREALSALGGSLVLAGSQKKAKIHIHVNSPDRVFEAAEQFGSVSGEKADDMQRQQSVTHEKNRNVAIVTDSAADIPEEQLEQLNIHLVPLRVHFGAKGFMDKVTISAPQFFRELSTNPNAPKTSQPAPGDFRRQYQYLASHFNTVIAPTLTGTVSGTLSAARNAAMRTAPGKIEIVDTRNASAGQGLLTILAAELARDGSSPAEIKSALNAAIPETRTFALLQNLDAAVRGGRVPAYARWVAEFLHLNPVLGTTADGRIKPISALPGRKRRIQKFVRFITRKTRRDQRYRINIAHAQAESEAVELGESLSAAIGEPGCFYCSELGAAIGVHGGAGTLVAAVMPDR